MDVIILSCNAQHFYFTGLSYTTRLVICAVIQCTILHFAHSLRTSRLAEELVSRWEGVGKAGGRGAPTNNIPFIVVVRFNLLTFSLVIMP